MVFGSAQCADGGAGSSGGRAETRRAERQRWTRRRRLERRLHDGAALRISALTLQLGLLRHRVPAVDRDLHESIDGFEHELQAVLQELREVASELYPPLLDEAGLGPALREQAGRLDANVVVTTSDERFGPALEGAAYFAVVAALAGLPPGGSTVEVSVTRADDSLVVHLAGVDGSGARHLRDGVRPLGGTTEVVAGDRPGTATIIARFPCE
ncbi:histidine kinase [Pseudonocardia sp. KRD-184]|uniref:Histidine kinase n=1 Tax=Pseudonocardia oceani TaxID=2792013 RepID=A0ABS6UD42_9PSEU|nr:histidine kinase [Pseudonocardia oceani]MBW0088507.1 histidine kinase [Pseudonocardia oceani]MBW0095439.1 histidine kinase [Pseudonocardia oceani]MBW0108078.1 histidine kinase [Pseudonocardia oceani]MBW0122026.1 histidine kinase [Pseudonocardia oceani]MBW0129806.1 histidine kinase [Pseudonocardia oceani]